MRIVCVDHDEAERSRTVALCQALVHKPEVVGFSRAGEALAWLENNRADAAILEIRLPDLDGITLAERIGQIRPELPVLFLTADEGHALRAFSVHALDYLLKPVSPERLAAGIEYAVYGRKKQLAQAPAEPIFVRTFGEFDLYVNGERVSFSRGKAKEVLAYLVDRQGSSVRRATIFAALWEDAEYTRPMQKQLDVMIRSLRMTLETCGAGRMLEVKNGSIRVIPERFACDMYRFIAGDPQTVNAYRGEYMSSYSWASPTEAYLDRINKRLQQ